MSSHSQNGGVEGGGQALPSGYELDEYVIDHEIGSGGFGVTYKGYDKNLNRVVAIKEYFPFDLASRGQRHTVSPKTQAASDISDYRWGLDGFIQEARTLALFEHPSIIRVVRYIERNNTAYIVMEFADGQDVSNLLSQRGVLSIDEVKSLIVPIIEGLAVVHAAGMLHRDIKPANIRIRASGAPVLIDFGAARQAIGARSRSISTVFTAGYAPIEQYSSRGNQGPWTDIYSLSAVAYVALTGENIYHFEATERIRRDTLPRLADRIEGGDRAFIEAIDRGLSPEESDRPQSVTEWLELMAGGSGTGEGGAPSAAATPYAAGSVNVPAASGADDPLGRVAPATKPMPWLAMAAASVGLVVALLLGYMALSLRSGSEPKGSVAARQHIGPTTEAAPPTPGPANDGGAGTAFGSAGTIAVTGVGADDQDFETARQIDTPEAFTIYLRRHPDGSHREYAESRAVR